MPVRGGRALLYAQAYAYCCAFRVALWSLPTRRVLAHVHGRVEAARTAARDGDDVVQLICHAVRASGRRLWRSTCLVEALAAQMLLARHGVHSTLRIGVEMDGEEFGAHAWVEVDGHVVVGGRRGRRYRLLPDFSHLLWTGAGGVTGRAVRASTPPSSPTAPRDQSDSATPVAGLCRRQPPFDE